MLTRTLFYLRTAFRRVMGRTPLLRSAFVPEPPEHLAAGTVYVVGEPYPWCAILACPCGCGDTIYANLVRGTPPRWWLHRHPDGTLTVLPSIWRTVGCEAHFTIRRGVCCWHGHNSGSR